MRYRCASCGFQLVQGDEGWVIVTGYRRAEMRGSGSNLLSRIKVSTERYCRACVVGVPGQTSLGGVA